MASTTWRSGQHGNFADPTQYAGGALPLAGDTLVVSGDAGAAPMDGYGLYVLLPGLGDSEVGFQSPSPDAPTVIASLTPQPTIGAEEQFPGAKVRNLTMDLIGGSGAAGGTLLLTDFAPSTTINVSGTAVLNLEYDNTLRGVINVGAPLAVNGVAVPPAVQNSHGATSELDLNIAGYGSTDADNAGNQFLRAYRPQATNTGVINVASGGQLRLGFDAGPSGGYYVQRPDGSYKFISSFAGTATFDNKGAINIGPGAGLAVLDNAEGLKYSPSPIFNGFWGQFVNDGQVNVRGAQGRSTAAEFQGFLTGSGLLTVDGGDAEDPAQTVLRLDATTYGANFTVRDATLQAFDHDLNSNRIVGGSVTFADGRGVLEVSADGQASAPYGSSAPNPLLPGFGFATPSIQLPFGAAIQGFQAGDHIRLDGLSDLQDFGQSYYLVWDQPSNTLSVMLSGQPLQGLPTQPPTLVAQFSVAGTYAAAQFGIQFNPTPNAGGSPISGTADITTTSMAPAPTPPVAPRFAVTDLTSGASFSAAGDNYAGPVDYLQSQYINAGSDAQAVAALSDSVFIKGSGNEALQVHGGNNVLDGGTGSNFLVGASGADGGSDTFFTDVRSPVVVWDTLVNFHRGDTATIWGYQPGTSSYSWTDDAGATGYTGATLRADVTGSGNPDQARVTFAGLPLAAAQGNLVVTTGSVGDTPYLAILFAA